MSSDFVAPPPLPRFLRDFPAGRGAAGGWWGRAWDAFAAGRRDDFFADLAG